MTITKAITKAIKVFESKQRAKDLSKEASIRSIELFDWVGNRKGQYEAITFRVEYAIRGDYTESDTKPLYIRVDEIGKDVIGCSL